MKDSAPLAALKLFVRGLVRLELFARRAFGRLRERPLWSLSGGCNRCGRCCEEPSIQVGAVLWFMPRARRLFLWWQRRVNGFELVSEDRATRTFGFRCTHFDPASRRCDSYASRPAMCRDYPRLLLEQPWPELFGECGFRVRQRGAERLLAGLEAAGLSEEQKARLRERLKLG